MKRAFLRCTFDLTLVLVMIVATTPATRAAAHVVDTNARPQTDDAVADPNYVPTADLIGLAERMYEGRHYDGAVEAAERVLSFDPDASQAYFILGRVFANRYSGVNARIAFGETIRLRPDWEAPYVELGLMLIGLTTLREVEDEPERLARKALSIEPRSAKAHLLLGLACFQKDRDEEAIAAWKRSIELKPDYAEPHVQMGWLYSNRKRYAEAIDWLSKAVRLDPDNIEAYSMLARACVYGKQFQKAREAVRELERLGSLEVSWLSKWTDTEERLDRLKAAAAARPKDAAAHKALGKEYLDRGLMNTEAREAREAYRRAVELAPKDPEARLGLGLSLVALKDLEGAKRELVTLRTLDRARATELESAIADRGESLFGTGGIPGGVPGGIPGGRPPFDPTRFRKKAPLPDAVAATIRRADASPSDRTAQYEAASACYEANLRDKSITYYKRVHALIPDHHDFALELAKLCFREMRYREAALFYERALTLSPSDADAMTDLGTTYYFLGENDQAVARYTSALAIATDSEKALVNLCLLLIERRDLATAEGILSRLERAHPSSERIPGLRTALQRARALRSPRVVGN